MSQPRLAPLARYLQIATLIVMVFLPVSLALALASAPARVLPNGIAVSPMITHAQFWGALAFGLAPLAAALWTLGVMRGLFAAYAAGEVLSDANAERIGRIGKGVLLIAASGLLIRPVQSVILTLANPAGQRQVSLSLSSNDVALLLAGGLLTLIGFAMREAVVAATENRSFV